jgi:anti-sigma factor RsiW
MSDPMSDEADRLIAAALRDHTRVAAPPRLRKKLEQRYVNGGRRRWLVPSFTALAGAAMAAIILMLVRPAPPTTDVATEAVGDHLRVIGGRGLGVETNNMHNVKPWFTGKLEFVPPVTFLGDDDFVLKGGDVAVFLGHKAAAFIYGRRLHVISLFVFESTDTATSERTIQGFHVKTWGSGGFGFALVSDVNWDEVRALRALL